MPAPVTATVELYFPLTGEKREYRLRDKTPEYVRNLIQNYTLGGQSPVVLAITADVYVQIPLDVLRTAIVQVS